MRILRGGFTIIRFCFWGHFKMGPGFRVKMLSLEGVSNFSGSILGTPNPKNQGGSKELLKNREPDQNPKMSGGGFWTATKPPLKKPQTGSPKTKQNEQQTEKQCLAGPQAYSFASLSSS